MRATGRRADRRAHRDFGDGVRPLLVVWTIGVIVLAIVRVQRSAAPEELFLDATAVAGVHWYAGMVSSLGVLAWTVAVAGCSATAYVASIGERVGAARAFRRGAIVLSAHLLDDLFGFHADLLPRLTGMPKPVWIAALVALTVLWLVPAFPELRRTRWGLFVAGGAGLAVSLAVDQRFGRGGEWYLLAEDGPKFLGVLALAAWSVTSAADVIGSVVTEARTSALEGTAAREADIADERAAR